MIIQENDTINSKLSFLLYSEFKTKFIDKIINEAKINTSFKSVLAFGSFQEKKLNYYSDLDLIIICKNKSISEVKFIIKNLFTTYKLFLLEYENKFIFYVHSTNEMISKFTKIEIFLVTNLKSVSKYIIESISEKNSYTDLLLFNRSKKVEKKLMKLENVDKEKNFPDLYSSAYHIHRIVEAYELSCKNFEKGDDYRFYFHMNLCFHHLVVLENMNNGNADHLYLPEFSLKFVKKTRKKFFKTHTPSLDMTKANLYRIQYLKTFFELLDEIDTKKPSNVNIDKNEIVKFLTNLIDSTYFWNLREISYIQGDTIKKNQLFRSSTLSLYKNDPKLIQFLRKNSIKTILDLRANYEKNEYPYENEITNLVVLENTPIDPKKELAYIDLKYSSIGTIESFYELFPTHYQSEIREILLKLSNCQFPVIIHCHAGKDRTGLIIALVLLILDTPEDLIIEDYLNSFSDTKLESINIFLGIIKEYGGISTFLQDIGVTQKDLDQIRNKLKVQ